MSDCSDCVVRPIVRWKCLLRGLGLKWLLMVINAGKNGMIKMPYEIKTKCWQPLIFPLLIY